VCRQRALKEMDLADDGESAFQYQAYLEMDKRFPYLLIKLDEYQETMRAKFMGKKWWERKLRKYMEVKHELRYTKENIDTVQAREERAKAVQAARRQRIAARKKEARETTSTVKRNLLVALNMAESMLV
jgi:hypothetical protein